MALPIASDFPGNVSEAVLGQGPVTQAHNDNAFTYLRGLLTMERNRNYASIARRVNGLEGGQRLQHFMSDSPWSAKPVFDQIQKEIGGYPELHGGMLTLDESGDKKAGEKSAGVARQYPGRLGKVDLGQVGVTPGYYRSGEWMMVDAELYPPEVWFSPEFAGLRPGLHIPSDRTFRTKLEPGLEMIFRAGLTAFPSRSSAVIAIMVGTVGLGLNLTLRVSSTWRRCHLTSTST